MDHLSGATNGSLSEIIEVLSVASEWIVLCHVHPDGDALGSASAFFTTGEALGKTVVWGGPDSLPSRYSFIAGTEHFREHTTLSKLRPGVNSAVVVLDTSTRARSVADISYIQQGVPLLNIDHHADNELFGTINYVDPSASSTGEIVYMLFREWGVRLSINALEALYTAISTDCGSFAFSCTTPRTHRIAADLLEGGVSPSKMNNLIRSGSTVQSLHLRGIALSRAFIDDCYAAYSWLRREDFHNTGSAPSDTESIVSDLLFLREVELAAFLVEEDDGIRVSIRSRGALEAAEIARHFGGGGHRQAAGCIIPLPISTALESIRSLVEGKNVRRNTSH